MSHENNYHASALSLSESPAFVTLAVSDLKTLLNEMKTLRDDFERFKTVHKDFAIRTTNEIDDLFAKQNIKSQTRPGKKQEMRLNKLEALLIARGNEPITYAEIGKFLELGSRTGNSNTRKQNMTILGKILVESKDRFEVFDSSTQKGAKMVRLSSKYFSKGATKG